MRKKNKKKGMLFYEHLLFYQERWFNNILFSNDFLPSQSCFANSEMSKRRLFLFFLYKTLKEAM